MKYIIVALVLALAIILNVYVPVEKVTPTNKKKVDQIRINQLMYCKNEIIKKNEDLMKPPAVGIWGELADISAELVDNHILVTYIYKQGLYNPKNKLELDDMQRVYSKLAGCSRDDIDTRVE
jgi:hypothetical protein